MPSANLPDFLDVGCGPRKAAGAWGIDGYAYPGVDQTLNLDHLPWDLPADHFSRIAASHVIEHVADIPAFLREIHRVGKAGCEVTISTPHFTGIDSWADPTHRWHLACAWHLPFTDPTRYLNEQMPRFRHVSTTVDFPGGPMGQLGRFITWRRGPLRWEKRFAWMFPARGFVTVLQVDK